MKQITMDYDEFITMKKLIETQQAQITEFQKGDNVVLVDVRDNSFRCQPYYLGVPKVIGDKDKAKEMLQAEFDDLQKEMVKLREEMDKRAGEDLNSRLTPLREKVKNSFWRI